MRKLAIFVLAFVTLLALPAFASEEGCGGSGGGLTHYHEADTYNMIDKHSFHTVWGLNLVQMNSTDDNILQANAFVLGVETINVNTLGLLTAQPTLPTCPVLSTSNTETRYNRISSHAFHDVRGLNVVQMNAGSNNVLEANLIVVLEDGFMESLGDSGIYAPHEHE